MNYIGSEREKPSTRSPQLGIPKRPSEPKEPSKMSWFDRQASNHNFQLVAVALISGITVAGAIYGTQAIQRKERVEELKASIPELSEDHKADLVRTPFIQ